MCSDVQVFPLLQLSGREGDSHSRHFAESVVALLRQGVLAGIQLLQGLRLLQLLSFKIHYVVVVDEDCLHFGQFEHHVGQVDERVVAQVKTLELDAVAQFFRQLRHLVVGQVQFCYKTELERKLGRDLGEEIPREVASGQRRIPHQVEDGVRDLTQLTLAQI